MNEAHDVELALGYLRVLLSAPPMTVLGVLVLVWVFRSDLKAIMSRSRIATIKFPGGELTTSQVIDHTEKTGPEEPPPDLPEAQQATLRALGVHVFEILPCLRHSPGSCLAEPSEQHLN